MLTAFNTSPRAIGFEVSYNKKNEKKGYFMSVQHISDQSFTDDVLNHKGFVLVDFWAEWCGPCRAISSVLDDLAADYASTLSVKKLNIDENPDTPMRYGVRSIPTLMLFKDGQVVQTQVGALAKSTMEEWLKKAMA